MSVSPSPDAACPCGSGKSLPQCCGRWLAGEPAPTAEALMRSRYSAFALGRDDYLVASWHPRTRPASVAIDPAQRWLGLDVKSQRPTGDNSAEVEFVARSRRGGGRAERLHERSRFERIDGRWYYLDGDLLP